MSGSLARVAGVVCASVLVVAGCGGDPEPEPGPVPGFEPTEVTAEPSEEPTEAEGPGAIPTEYPEVGLTFVDLPEVEEEWHEALRTYVDYERGVAQMRRDVEWNDLITDNIEMYEYNDVWRRWEGFRKHHVDSGVRYRGETVFAFREVIPREGRLSMEICVDWSEGVRVARDGSETPSDLGRLTFSVVVVAVGGRWVVNQVSDRTGDC